MRTLYILIIIIVVLSIGGILFYFYSKPAPESDHQPTVPFTPLFESNNSCEYLGCPEGSVYAGSINSDKYYPCDCRYAKNINPENVVCFGNDAEALAENRTKSDC